VPPSQAKALQLARIEELSLSEASARSGSSVGALKVATHCALNTLRKRLSAP
jgi:RNA polymerase sigma-70 factor (ECF subfamily)